MLLPCLQSLVRSVLAQSLSAWAGSPVSQQLLPSQQQHLLGTKVGELLVGLLLYIMIVFTVIACIIKQNLGCGSWNQPEGFGDC